MPALRLPLDASRRTAVGSVDVSGLTPELDRKKGRIMKEAYRLGQIDPVTGELVRMRNARLQDCHVCQNFRDPAAQQAGASEAVLALVDDYEAADLPERQKVALRLVDAYLTRPDDIGDELRADLLRHFTPAEVVELLVRLASTTGNRVLRTLGLDDDALPGRDQLAPGLRVP